MFLAKLLEKGIQHGHLTLFDAHGRRYVFGDAATRPRAAIRLHDPALHRALAVNPWLKVGEAYMDGTLTIEDGTLTDFLELAALNRHRIGAASGWEPIAHALNWSLRWLQQRNPIGLARSHVAHHYDLSRDLFDQFLDEDLQYSCAYFRSPDESLDSAQRAKKRHIAAKMLLEPGQRVLDIGCGWGGMAIYLAQVAQVEVLGVTLSQEQHAVACRRAVQAGVADRVRFELRDYRSVSETFDRVVSVGMFEHVGVRHYPEFFGHLDRLLGARGIALLHSIGRREGPGYTNPWLRKYIFPGGYVPALSEVIATIEPTRLWVTDVEILRLHYAETLRAWRQRFEQNRDRIRRLYDDRFCRMWEFYLVGCEVSFRHDFSMVFQMQLTPDRTAVPLTRDYITEWERAQERRETERLQARSRPAQAA